MKIFIPILTLISMLLFTSSCQTLDVRGQYVDDSTVNKLENKNLTKAGVEELIGTPTIIPDYTPDTWYYVHRFMGKRAWFQPKTIEQRIVKIKFTKDDIIEEVVVLNDNHTEDIEVVSEYTKAYGTEQNGIQTFIKNIGRFNKTTDGKKKRSKK
ncbi:Outer membrane protein assembly factor BamE [Candidatus Trichorickettsia mobilis]|uniref:Outer membrane protein assembly factor BamE n=1 Tax=Candidatus Trichorickettsia mobilis TaxID=1346319 RepID=A0ABZ0USC0_9RICK|nr:outer membrane protein assembly factor BamE [Candidatus Trichorickettsia mobilis]WPY00915.1 Outer membrane protein assembly factor BamE [Candidatus Trichorickettsia mobilis]